MTAFQPSFRLLATGIACFAFFVLLLFVSGSLSEASLVARVIVFIGLIPPPVCFGAGIGIAFLNGLTVDRAGIVANTAALLGHGILSIILLEHFLV